MTLIRSRPGNRKGDTSRELTTLVRLPWRKVSPNTHKIGGRPDLSDRVKDRRALPLSDRHQAALDLLPATPSEVARALGLNRSQAASALNALALRDRAWSDRGTWRAK